MDTLMAAGVIQPSLGNDTPPPQPAPDAVTQVAPLTVRPDGDPNKPIPYDNSRDRTALNDSMKDINKPSGIWGLLPEKIQHGALRDVLGAIGDAYLQSGGHDAQYKPRQERQQAGQALAGYANKPEAAIERFQATGYPGSVELGAKMQDNLTTNNIRADNNAANNQLHQDQLAQQRINQTGQQEAREENIVARMSAQIGGLASQAKTPQQYAQVYAQAETMAQRVSSRLHATDFGLVSPDIWSPGLNLGITGGQQQASEDRAAGLVQSDTNNRRTTSQSDTNNRRSTATSAANNARSTGASIGNNERSIAARGDGSGTTGLHPKTGTTAAPRQSTSTTANAPRTAPKAPVVSNGDVSFLRGHDTPQNRAMFDQHFGAGSARKYLGH